MSDENPITVLEARIHALESALAHQQHEFEQLNEVVIQQGASIDKLARSITLLETTVQDVRQRLPEDQDASEEKPPHY